MAAYVVAVLAAVLCYLGCFHRPWLLAICRRLRPQNATASLFGLLLLFLAAAAGLAAVMTLFFVLLGHGLLQPGGG